MGRLWHVPGADAARPAAIDVHCCRHLARRLCRLRPFLACIRPLASRSHLKTTPERRFICTPHWPPSTRYITLQLAALFALCRVVVRLPINEQRGAMWCPRPPLSSHKATRLVPHRCDPMRPFSPNGASYMRPSGAPTTGRYIAVRSRQLAALSRLLNSPIPPPAFFSPAKLRSTPWSCRFDWSPLAIALCQIAQSRRACSVPPA